MYLLCTDVIVAELSKPVMLETLPLLCHAFKGKEYYIHELSTSILARLSVRKQMDTAVLTRNI